MNDSAKENSLNYLYSITQKHEWCVKAFIISISNRINSGQGISNLHLS